jgi:hypothetical protein
MYLPWLLLYLSEIIFCTYNIEYRMNEFDPCKNYSTQSNDTTPQPPQPHLNELQSLKSRIKEMQLMWNDLSAAFNPPVQKQQASSVQASEPTQYDTSDDRAPSRLTPAIYKEVIDSMMQDVDENTIPEEEEQTTEDGLYSGLFSSC